MDVGISSFCAGNRFLRFSRNILGDVVPRWSPLPSLFSYQNRTGDYGAPFCPSQTQYTATALAVHCNRSCSALHPSLQCTASSTHTCNLSRKYLQPSLHVLATAPASTCGKRRHYLGSLPLPLQSLSPVFWHTAVQAAESCAWVSYVMRTGARRGSSQIIPIWEDPL